MTEKQQKLVLKKCTNRDSKTSLLFPGAECKTGSWHHWKLFKRWRSRKSCTAQILRSLQDFYFEGSSGRQLTVKLSTSEFLNHLNCRHPKDYKLGINQRVMFHSVLFLCVFFQRVWLSFLVSKSFWSKLSASYVSVFSKTIRNTDSLWSPKVTTKKRKLNFET